MKKNKDLRDFLDSVRKAGSDFYVEVKQPLDPELQVCVLQQKLAKRGRFPVISCPEIKGSKISLVSNLFGSYEMLGMALGIDSKTGTDDIEEATFFPFGEGGPQKTDRAGLLQEFRQRVAGKIPPEIIPSAEAPVKEVILKGKDANLDILPLTRHGKLDSKKYITIGYTVCKDPDTGMPNVGIYRHEVKGKDKLGVGLNPAHHAAYIARRYAELGKPMEVAICIGHHPAAILGAQAKGSIDLNEFEVMGGFLGESLLLVKAETVDLHVPAYAEIIIEGVVEDASDIVQDGPFAEYTGHYGEKGGRAVYVVNITAITMRKNAIYHDLDPANREHNLIPALFYESAVYDMVKRIVPTLKAVSFPLSGTAALHTYVSIRKRIQGEGKLAALAALAADHSIKLVVVVDEDIDVYDEQEVMWAVATRMNGQKDITVIPWVTATDLDPSGYNETGVQRGHMDTKVIIDATRPVGTPFATRIAPDEELWKSMKLSNYIDLS
ncbi:UbiD family decarboxylase [Chloroflexota bacterium]